MTSHFEPHEIVAHAVSMVSGKWKVAILSNLSHGPVRYNELQRLLGPISAKVLTDQLGEMEDDELVTRTPLSISSKSYGYESTNLGIRLWRRLSLFGEFHKDFSPRTFLSTVAESNHIA